MANKQKHKYGCATFVQGVVKGGSKGKKTFYSIQDALQECSNCCECGTYNCCNGVYAKMDVATGENLGCFINNGVEECHECAEAHRLANEARQALLSGK